MNGYDGLRTACAWVDLSTLGKLRATGEDRARLLHAMSTNDVANLADGHGVYAFFLSAQGRILADAKIYNLGASLWLDTEPETAGKLFEHLDKYIIADDVTLDNWTSEWSATGIEGPESPKVSVGLGVPVPETPFGVLEYGDGFVARVAAAGVDGLRVFLPTASQPLLLEKLQAASVVRASHEDARTVRIENKRPRYGEDISERYLTQETQCLDAVHFSKGCYVGQEIVERVRSRGQVHRLLTAIEIEGEAAPAAGTKIVADAKDAGEITSAVWSPALDRLVGFAYLRAEALESGAQLQVRTGAESVPQQASVRL